jgi:hypothetical protein
MEWKWENNSKVNSTLVLNIGHRLGQSMRIYYYYYYYYYHHHHHLLSQVFFLPWYFSS